MAPGGDSGVVTELQAMLRDRPPTLTVAHLSALDEAGHQYGWLRSGYRDALLATDRKVGRILNTIKASPALADHTLVVLTSEHGGRATTTPTGPSSATTRSRSW